MGKETELIKAAKTGDLKLLEKYLGQQTKRTSVIGSIRKPMHPNVQDELGYTLLHHATLNGHAEVVTFLLDCGASTTIPDSSGSYPIHLASWKGDLEILKLIVSHGMSRPNIDQQSNSEDTALHLASQYGYCSVVEFLLERHANPMLKNIRGETPLDLASQFGHVDTVHVLISHCPELLDFSRQEISSLHLAARNGHTMVVLSLINAGISVNTLCTGGTALHEAAMCGKEDTVKLLLDKGIDPTLKDSQGNTALNLLSEIPAASAQRIHQLISQYTNKTRVPTNERYMKPRKYRLLAVPVRDSVTSDITSEEDQSSQLPQLQYRKDESITIQGRQSPEVYIGILHKVLGTFPINDMRIFQEIDGKLYEVMKNDVIDFDEEGGIHVRQKSSSFSSTGGGGEKKKDKPKTKKQHRMTDQEKKFVLSKDTGTYSQLTPVSAPSTSTAEVKQISTPTAATNGSGQEVGPDGGAEYLGNYYLLEVGSMEATPPTSPEKNDDRGDIPSPPNYPAPHLRDDIPPPPIEPPPQPAIITKSIRPPSYENVEVKPHLPLKKKRTKSFEAPQTVNHLPLPGDRPRSRTTRTSTYENVTPFISDSDNSSSHYNETLPTGIPAFQDYSHLQPREPEFKISHEPVQDDVVVSSLNPNYIKVNLTNRPNPVQSDDEEKMEEEVRGKLEEPHDDIHAVTSPEGSVWFIPHENDPFAGLVQSCSVTSGGGVGAGMEFDDSPSQRDRLKSVWDDKRVSREWTQINDFISSLNTTLQEYESQVPELSTKATPTADEKTLCVRSPVSLWLSGMRLEGLSNVFESNGFDDMEFMGGDILTVADLQELGIYGEDQSVISARMLQLRLPPLVRHCTSVTEWLDALHLSSIKDCFVDYTLEKIANLWEMQLQTVLGIEELGYRKRLWYGITELRVGHPEWCTTSGDTVSLLRNESGQSTSAILQQVNFTKDYTKIKSLKNENGASVESLPLLEDTTEPCNLKWVESGLNRTRNSHSTSSLEKQGVLRSHSSCDTPVTSLRYQNVTPTDLRRTEELLSSHGHSSPTLTPSVRGNDYATVKPDEENEVGLGRVIHQERKRTTIVTPPTQVHNYNTWYLGSSMVKGVVGKHSAEEACLKLRTQTDGIAKIPQIVLSISWKGVKFVDAQSKMVVSNHLIRDISHCCPDIEDERVFAYMTKEKETGRSYCHVFMADSKEMAEEIIMTVGQAFEVAYQAVIKARSHYSPPVAKNKKKNKSPIKSSLKSSFRKLNPKRNSKSASELESSTRES